MDPNPVRQAIADFPGGPLVYWLLLGVPLVMVFLLAAYWAIRAAYDRGPRRRRSQEDQAHAADALQSLDDRDTPVPPAANKVSHDATD